MPAIISRNHPINDDTVGPHVVLDMTKHRDGMYSLRVNAEMLNLIEEGMSNSASLAASFADRPWTTPEFQHARAKRFTVLGEALRRFKQRNG